ncbi:UDP-N-acetylmuramate dehydrogenase [Anaerobranca californiensis DSM 14826]|jgi:UDP-N-acetylmuramate dehydrogenase|uniref:UDP-N-acetylenolpyruvoylglucosamine reductase n=1 Tax=Anaerobranca californiensis DSM 14826 TaxID=1120989 RepID=A0A1M6Q5L3_9FIRM|nr:UDP-N-acetylmuramate dehydrogenase [Anaerobranca californiensis]SHK15534.1 UDP-N-acetylmuramate dehydrogenase [Anaerobranca californiensis DSM 14826]
MVLEKELKTILGEENLKINHPLKDYTTFKIGGPADYFATPETEEALLQLINYARELDIPFFILGKGSNILISDEGYRGIIINLTEKLNKITVEGEKIYAQSGATLTDISKRALEHSLTGFEFAIGIPGSFGGGIFMNAGAYEGQMSDVVERVWAIRNGEIVVIDKEEMEFGYRKSVFQKYNDIIIRGCIKLKKGDYNQIKGKMDELTEKREGKQPLELPSAGSVFKRPPGNFAGKLIEDSGLRGYRIGGAQVSEKHCGFIVNTGEATAQDVKNLIEHIQRTVKEKFAVELEREVKYL